MEAIPAKRPRFSLRQLFIVVTMFGLLLTVAIAAYPKARVFWSTFATDDERRGLKYGMTEEEVARLLGNPYATDRYLDGYGREIERWDYRQTNDFTEAFQVYFNASGQVIGWDR